MLLQTFCHIPGIGEKKERKIWELGILSWQDALQDPAFLQVLPSPLSRRAYAYLVRSFEKYEKEDVTFFDRLLGNFNRWRIFPQFKHLTAFLDIETTGVGTEAYITVATLYDGKRVKTYVFGINLEELANDLRSYKVLITFNGKSFDIPFIERFFGIELHQVHIDLRFVLKSLGLQGGLKACERLIGIDRGPLRGIGGFEAVLLWQKYLEGCPEALETLLAYNVADTINLERLMIFAYNQKVSLHAFPFPLLSEKPLRLALPYRVYPEVIREVTYEKLRLYQ